MNMPQSALSPLSPDVVAGAASPAAVSWAAILAGALAAAAVSLILLAIGSGFDLLAVSPWSGGGATLTTFTVMTAIWFIVMQWVSAGVGGYLAGRLRTRWVGTHTHEVFFRDTAHGLVTWAVSSILAATLFVSAAASLTTGQAHAMTALTDGMMPRGSGPAGSMASGYDLDLLFRGTRAETNGPGSDPRPEALRIVATGLAEGDVPAADRAYLTSLVSARTGVAQPEAAQRVDTLITHSKETADKARKAAAAFALYSAVSLLIGAFIACVAAALGGQRRDLHP